MTKSLSEFKKSVKQIIGRYKISETEVISRKAIGDEWGLYRATIIKKNKYGVK